MSRDPLLDSSKLFCKTFNAEAETDSPTCQFEIWDSSIHAMTTCGQIALSGRRVCAEHEDRDVKRGKK